MSGLLETLFQRMTGFPAPLMYLILGAAAALENAVPPVPADTIVLFGGFLAARSTARIELVFLAVWVGNVTGALFVYRVGARHGPAFFAKGWGNRLLRPGQLVSLNRFYLRYGIVVIFVSRFLPMFRAVVPVFAGVAGVGFWRTALPIAIASGLWYGALVYLGALAGRNWERILEQVSRSSQWFGLAALVVGGVIAVWWWRSRRAEGSG